MAQVISITDSPFPSAIVQTSSQTEDHLTQSDPTQKKPQHENRCLMEPQTCPNLHVGISYLSCLEDLSSSWPRSFHSTLPTILQGLCHRTACYKTAAIIHWQHLLQVVSSGSLGVSPCILFARPRESDREKRFNLGFQVVLQSCWTSEWARGCSRWTTRNS